MKVAITFQDAEKELVDRLVQAVSDAVTPIPSTTREALPKDGYRHIYITTPRPGHCKNTRFVV